MYESKHSMSIRAQYYRPTTSTYARILPTRDPHRAGATSLLSLEVESRGGCIKRHKSVS